MILQNVSDSLVPLDVLNNHYEPLARYEARLLDLHGDWATLTLPAAAPVSCLHWGSLVRFTFTDGSFRSEAEGVVVAHRVVAAEETAYIAETDTPYEADAGIQEGTDFNMPGSTLLIPSATREITVQLWQCQQKEERRLGPRRWPRIAVLLRPELEALPMAFAPAESPVEAEECWERGWAVDFSANGMRLRTHVCLPLKQRVALQFALPDAAVRSGSGSLTSIIESLEEEQQRLKRRFTLRGRVLRSERTRTASSHQAMICFEQLTAEEGLAISRFLSRG